MLTANTRKTLLKGNDLLEECKLMLVCLPKAKTKFLWMRSVSHRTSLLALKAASILNDANKVSHKSID